MSRLSNDRIAEIRAAVDARSALAEETAVLESAIEAETRELLAEVDRLKNKRPKRRKIFVVTVVTSEEGVEDGSGEDDEVVSQTRIEYVVAARTPVRADQMVRELLDGGGSFSIIDVQEQDNPWLRATTLVTA